MSKKEIDVTCPCCDSELLVDVGTGQVLRSRAAGERDGGEASWTQAKGRVEGRGDRGQDAFDQALSGEQSRERDLDDLFDQAKERALERKKRDL